MTDLSLAAKFTSAGTAGCLGWVCVHPFNTAAIRMNLSGGADTKFFPFISQYLKSPKKFLSLYDGLGAGVARQVFYASTRFGLFEVFRDEITKYLPLNMGTRALVGCASGACAALISCPAETTLVRLSNDSTLPEAQRRNYKGIYDAFARIMTEEGPSAFFAASGPFMNRAIIVGMVQVGTLDQFKETYREYGIKDKLSNTFCAAMSSGLLYSVATMPLESAKNRIAFQKPDPQTGEKLYKSSLQTVGKIAREEGMMSLFNGFAPYYLRCGGHTVTMFMFLELIRGFMVK
jgi:solute carrier family 25 (mitochondrial oxoglutarate transporter), member 11